MDPTLREKKDEGSDTAGVTTIHLQNYYLMVPAKKVQFMQTILQSMLASKWGIQRNEEYEYYRQSKEKAQSRGAYSVADKKRPNSDTNIGIPITLTSDSLKLSDLLVEISNELSVIPSDLFIFPITQDMEHLHKPSITGNIKDILAGEFPEEVVKFVSRSFDIVGSIAIMEIDRWDDLKDCLQANQSVKSLNISDLKNKIGQVLLNHYKGIKTILNKAGEVSGEFRTRKFEFLAGENTFSTVHRENNCAFELDISKVFFTPRLVHERERVSLIPFKPKETVLDCFSGVGPFSIQIGCTHNVNIVACEKNPDAFRYLEKNIQRNRKRMKGKIQPYLGDFRELKDSDTGKLLHNSVDYIIMNLPELSLEFIGDIKYYVKKGTYLIIYSFAPGPDPLDTGFQAIEKQCSQNKIKILQVEGKRIVKNYSPHTFMVVFDLRLQLEEN